MNSYDEILSNKSSLEFEINTYRRLLESEEAHVKKINETTFSPSSTNISRNHQNISKITKTEQTITTTKQNLINETKINQTEMQAKTTFQRSAKGFYFIFI